MAGAKTQSSNKTNPAECVRDATAVSERLRTRAAQKPKWPGEAATEEAWWFIQKNVGNTIKLRIKCN